MVGPFSAAMPLCFAAQNSSLQYTRSCYQHTTPMPHIALWRTRPFWAAHMMSKGRSLFCTEILLRPFAARGCSLQQVGLLYNAYDSNVVLNLPTALCPLCSTHLLFPNTLFPFQHRWPLQDMGFLYSTVNKRGLGRDRVLCSTYTKLWITWALSAAHGVSFVALYHTVALTLCRRWAFIAVHI